MDIFILPEDKKTRLGTPVYNVILHVDHEKGPENQWKGTVGHVAGPVDHVSGPVDHAKGILDERIQKFNKFHEIWHFLLTRPVDL